MANDVRMDPAAASPFIERFTTMRETISTVGGSFGGHADRIVSGCGEFSCNITGGSTAFEIAWRKSLEVTGTSAGVIAGNINTFEIEVTKLDQELATVPDISGSGN